MWFLWLVLLAAGVSFAGPLGAVAVVALWVVVSYLPGKRSAEREEARFFEDSEEISELSDSKTVVDFQEMTLTTRFRSAGEPDSVEQHPLERRGEGRWAYQADSKQVPIRGQFASRLEVAYQRYLKTLLVASSCSSWR